MPAPIYSVRLPPTAVTISKTLWQVKAGLAALELIGMRLGQTTKTASELWEIQIARESAAGTVTSATPNPLNSNDPASLAVGSTSGTGINASAEGTYTTILEELTWNLLNAEYLWLPVPEGRIWVPQAGILGVRNITVPAASTSLQGTLLFREYLG